MDYLTIEATEEGKDIHILLYCVGFSFCLSYPIMTQVLIFSKNSIVV